MLAARAASCSFLILGTIAVHRGRSPQFVFIRSRINNAVVLGSTVTALSSGTGGGFTVAHSETMSPVHAGVTDIGAEMATAVKAAAANRRLRFKSVMTFSFRSRLFA